MSRKETSNTWQDGLVMDLNPMNTPNTVLTDNLNGTIITYNGNEHLLQNDQGNFKLKYCKLSPNFVPVGLKEYADILYIVSYNPVTEETEIGSYPSPMNITESSFDNGVADEAFAIDKILEKGSYFKYHDIDKYNYNFLFAKDGLKLNPGDEFQLVRQGTKRPIYEGVEYKIMDENKTFHDISEIIEEYLKSTQGSTNVLWDVPGWMSISSRIADFNSFGVSITQFSSLNDFVTIGYKFQISIDDPILISAYKEGPLNMDIPGFYLDLIDIKLSERISNLDETEKTLSSSEEYGDEKLTWTVKEWYDGNIILQSQELIHTFNITDCKDRTVTISAVPILRDIFNDRNYSIEYAHFTETIDADFNNFVGINNSNLSFGDKIYKFSTNEGEETQITFNVRIKDIDDSIPVMNDIGLYAKLFTVDNKPISRDNGFIELDISADDLVVDSEDDDKPVDNSCFIQGLEPEEIYKVLFVLTSDDLEEFSDSLSKTKNALDSKGIVYYEKVLVTSKIFSEHSYSDYSDYCNIPMNTWVTDYINKYFTNGKITVSEDIKVTPRKSNIIWNKNETYWENKGFITDSSKAPEEIIISQECDVEFTFNNTQNDDLKKFREGIWTSLIGDPEYYLSGLKDKNGNVYKEEEKVIPSKITSNYYGENIGEWDVNTANISGNKISYNNFTCGKQSITFSEPFIFNNYPLDVEIRDVIAKKRYLIFTHTGSDNKSEKWEYQLYNEQMSKISGVYDFINVKYFKQEKPDPWNTLMSKIQSDTNWDVMLVGVQAKKQSTNDSIVRFGNSDNHDEYLVSQSDNAISNIIYFVLFRGNTYPVFYDSDQSNFPTNLFEGCKIIKGTNPGTYYAFVPQKGGLNEDKNLSCNLLSNLPISKSWKWHNVNLFGSSDYPILNWSDSISVDSIQTSVSCNSDTRFDLYLDEYFKEQNDPISTVEKYILSQITDYNKYYDDRGYIGLRGGGPNISTIVDKTIINNGNLCWKESPSKFLVVGSTSFGDDTIYQFGYYVK